jgi:5-methyltetrahydropteroyltriglutamate--homocysteine methyltransferase
MKIPTEPIGSIPRPPELIAAIAAAGDFTDPALEPLYEKAVRETIEEFESTGSPVITDGEQRKFHNFCTYCVHGRVADPSTFLFRSGTLGAPSLRSLQGRERCCL